MKDTIPSCFSLGEGHTLFYCITRGLDPAHINEFDDQTNMQKIPRAWRRNRI